MKKILYLISITFLLLQSCSSSDSNSSNNLLLSGKLKRFHNVQSNGTNAWNNYFYDNNGRLIKITTTNESQSMIAQSITFVRDNNGKIINQSNVDYAGGVQINTDYTLDNNGFYLSSIKSYIGASNSPISATYIYSNNKISQTNFSDAKKEKYTYDVNGNLIKVEKSSGNGSWLTDQNITYDNKINFCQLDDIIIFNSGSNNLVSENTVNRPFNYSSVRQYNYNQDNKPLTGTFTESSSSQGQVINGTFEFFYY
jgi:hypothetical protein